MDNPRENSSDESAAQSRRERPRDEARATPRYQGDDGEHQPGGQQADTLLRATTSDATNLGQPAGCHSTSMTPAREKYSSISSSTVLDQLLWVPTWANHWVPTECGVQPVYELIARRGCGVPDNANSKAKTSGISDYKPSNPKTHNEIESRSQGSSKESITNRR